MTTSVSEERSTFVEALFVSLSLVSLETRCVIVWESCGTQVEWRCDVSSFFNPFFFVLL